MTLLLSGFSPAQIFRGPLLEFCRSNFRRWYFLSCVLRNQLGHFLQHPLFWHRMVSFILSIAGCDFACHGVSTLHRTDRPENGLLSRCPSLTVFLFPPSSISFFLSFPLDCFLFSLSFFLTFTVHRPPPTFSWS